MPIMTRGSRLLAAVAVIIAGVGPHAVAQETKGAPIVQRQVFAEHPTINVVNSIMRVKRDGLDGVLLVGSGNASMSCFVPDGGTASCVALKLTSVDAAQRVGSHAGDATSLLVHGLWGEPALALLGRNGEVAWRYDAKFTAMGHFAVLARQGGAEAVIAERNKGLLFFDAMTGKLRNTVQLAGQMTDVFRISGSDGHRYLMGLSGTGQVVVLTTAGDLVRATPNIGVFHAATSQGDNPVLFIAPKDTIYTLDEQLKRAGDWYAPQSGDLRISAVDCSVGPNGIVIALFIGSGSARGKTGLYVFGPDRRLLLTETSLYPNSGLLLLSSSEHSMAFLVGDRGRTWRYAITW
jgi:hypothetical protein